MIKKVFIILFYSISVISFLSISSKCAIGTILLENADEDSHHSHSVNPTRDSSSDTDNHNESICCLTFTAITFSKCSYPTLERFYGYIVNSQSQALISDLRFLRSNQFVVGSDPPGKSSSTYFYINIFPNHAPPIFLS